jgi:hypothetical protein
MNLDAPDYVETNAKYSTSNTIKVMTESCVRIFLFFICTLHYITENSGFLHEYQIVFSYLSQKCILYWRIIFFVFASHTPIESYSSQSLHLYILSSLFSASSQSDKERIAILIRTNTISQLRKPSLTISAQLVSSAYRCVSYPMTDRVSFFGNHGAGHLSLHFIFASPQGQSSINLSILHA